MTIDQAFEVIEKYGDICKDVNKLKKEKLTIQQLNSIKFKYMAIENVSEDEAIEAMTIVQKHFQKSDIEVKIK